MKYFNAIRFALPGLLLLFFASACDLYTSALDGSQVEGLLLAQSAWGNIGYNNSPVIRSFTSRYGKILKADANFNSTALMLSLEEQDPTRFRYSFEILEGGGSLSGPDRAAGKIYHAGETPGKVRIRVRVESKFGRNLRAEAVLALTILDAPHQKISSSQGEFQGPLTDQNGFGRAIAHMGDVNGDGVNDLAVGAPGDSEGGSASGAVWLLFMNADNSVKTSRKISSSTTGFDGGEISPADQFGVSVANLGDLDGDDVNELAVGAPGNDLIGSEQGAVWILFLNRDGSVKHKTIINDRQLVFQGTIANFDAFGYSVANAGDVNGDGRNDLLVGAPGDDSPNGARGQGAVYILFMKADGNLDYHLGDLGFTRYFKYGRTSGGLDVNLIQGTNFGASVARIGDLDGNGIKDLAVGSSNDGSGAVHILFLKKSGMSQVKAHKKFNSGTDGTNGFGASLLNLGTLNEDGLNYLAVGAPGDSGTGAVWTLALDAAGNIQNKRKLAFTQANAGDQFGSALANRGPDSGLFEIFAGAHFDDDGGENRGALWSIHLKADGSLIQ